MYTNIIYIKLFYNVYDISTYNSKYNISKLDWCKILVTNIIKIVNYNIFI